MKVLHIVPSLPQASGVTTFVVECSNALRGMGHEQAIVTKEDHADALARIDEFDIVHLHGIWPPFYHRFVIAARKRKIPIVWSIHGMLSPWAMKYKRWKKIPAWWLWQKRDLKSAAVLHVTSGREIEWVRAQGFTNRIVNIPLGTKLPDAVPARAHKPKRLLFVGRVNPIKALDNLIRAWNLARPVDWTLRIVGNDERGYQANLVRLVEELKLGACVEFPGPKFGKDLEEEYQNADALVLPSHTENFGAVVADALAWGLPVITSKGTPWKEVVVGSGSGSESGSGTVEEREGRGRGNRSTVELHPSLSASHFVSLTRFKGLAEKRPEELTSEEKREIVRAIEATEVICLGLPKDEKITRFLKGYWDGDAKVTRDIVEWGSGLVPVSVINRYIGEIRTHKNSIRSILFHTRFRGPLKVLVLERLADVLKYAVLYNKGRDGDETFYNLAHRLQFDPGDGKPVKEFIVRLIVKETAEGNRTWTVEFSNKKELTGMPTTGEAATIEVTHLKSPSTHTILKLLYAVNGAGGESRGRDTGPTADSNTQTLKHSNTSSRCGWWVENDPENLAKALRELTALSDEDRRAMGERGRELARKKYSWTAVAESVVKAWKSGSGEW